MEIKLEFGKGLDGIDDEMKRLILDKMKDAGHAIDEPARELQRKRIDMRLAAKSRL